MTDPRILAANAKSTRRAQYRQHIIIGFYWGTMMWVLFRAMRVFDGEAFLDDVSVQLPIWILVGLSVGWMQSKFRQRIRRD